MAETMTKLINRPAWVDLSSSDAASSREFYGRLFGWQVDVNPDPQYGGYAIAKSGGADAAGIGPKMDPNAPTTWNVYIGTDDLDGLAGKVSHAGGRVLMAPFAVGDQGRMAVFADPSGAVISAWQGTRMGGFQTDAPGAFGWAELSARSVDQALPFYTRIFGWSIKTSEMGEGRPPYHEFQIDGTSVAGAQELNPMAPAGVPNYWLVYFEVADVDDTFRRARELGASEMIAPMDFPGGRFAIVSDPQGASFGLLKTTPR